MVIERSLHSAVPGMRSRAFAWGGVCGHPPAAEQMNNANTALQFMLLQPGDDGDAASVVVFPAWPCSWEVDFKLAAPLNTTVAVRYSKGKLERFVVEPAERKAAVSFANCVNGSSIKADDELSLARPAPPVCPNATLAEAVAQTGLLSVRMFGAIGNGSADDAPAARAAFNMSRLCGGCVFFPPGDYRFATSVYVSGCVKGSQGFGSGVDGSTNPQTVIKGPGPGGGPVMIAANKSASNMLLQDLSLEGSDTGLLISHAYKIRLINVGISASANADGVDTSAAGCNATGCNVVLGSRNAALVVENSFWVWTDRCSFSSAAMAPCKDRRTDCDVGQRPSVILRGQPGGPVGTTYLVSAGVHFNSQIPEHYLVARTVPPAVHL